MMLQGVRDDETRLGYPMIWVPASSVHAERCNDDTRRLRTWVDITEPAVQRALADVGFHHHRDHMRRMYELHGLDASNQLGGGATYALPINLCLPDGDSGGMTHRSNQAALDQWGAGNSLEAFASETAALCANFGCPDYLVQQEKGSLQYYVLQPTERVESAPAAKGTAPARAVEGCATRCPWHWKRGNRELRR